MNIIVLLKRVPDLVEDLEVDASGKALDEDCVSLKLNEFDDHALEEALCLKESGAGSVTVVALDGDDVDKLLFTALAKGADRALKVTGISEDASYRQRADIFAEVVEGQPRDLILTGVQAADERDGQLAPMVAALMDLPCVEVVTSVAAAVDVPPRSPQGDGNGYVTVHKEFSGGLMAEYEVDLPAVLGIQAARQTPRYAPVSKVRQVQQSATLEEVAGPAVGASRISVVEMTPPKTGEGAQMLDSVDELVEVLKSKGVI